MPIRTTETTISTTVTELGEASSRRSTLVVMPPTAGTIYIGGAGVTAAAGYPLAAGDSPFKASRDIERDSAPAEPWHAVTSSGTATVRVIEIIA